MASPLTQRALQRVGDSGFSRAKKLADLAIKTNTDSTGAPTAYGYEQAMALLQPFIGSAKESEAIDAQRIVAGYSNSLTKLTKKEKDQTETVAAFKLQENDAYFTSFDGEYGGFRNPSDLVGATSESLDNLLLGVINAIDEKEANGDSTDALYAYMNDLQKRADTMRDVRNRFERGELSEGQTLDGFGYYVDTNPIDGSVRGAAFLPVGLAPEGMTAGYRRLEATTKLGNALLPVYAPVQKDSFGEYVARVGDATWSGTGDGALRSNSASSAKSLFEEGSFNIGDTTIFPVRKNGVDKGQFATALIGRDADGNPVDGVFYRGYDNKLYNVDQATLEGFQNDPVLSAKLNGYMPRFSPTEAQELAREAVPFTPDRIGRESKIATYQSEADKAAAEAARYENMGFFEKVGEGFKGMTGKSFEEVGNEAGKRALMSSIPGALPTVAVASFFQNKNKPNQPDEAPTGGSGNDIIESGKNFFRSAKEKVGGFFGR